MCVCVLARTRVFVHLNICVFSSLIFEKSPRISEFDLYQSYSVNKSDDIMCFILFLPDDIITCQ